jgi:hypothetical protein
MFTPQLLYLLGKKLPGSLSKETWVVPKDGVDAIEKRTIFCPYQQSSQNSLVNQPVA